MKKIIAAIIAVFIAFPVFSRQLTGFGLYAGAGTNAHPGFFAGAGAGYLIPNEENLCVEIGAGVYYSGFFENRTGGEFTGIYKYEEKNILYLIIANVYFNYNPQSAGMFEFIGAGGGGVSFAWDKSSADEPEHNDDGEETGGSAVVNLGVGGTFGNGFELKVQLPVLMTFTEAGGNIFSPALALSAGLRL